MSEGKPFCISGSSEESVGSFNRGCILGPSPNPCQIESPVIVGLVGSRLFFQASFLGCGLASWMARAFIQVRSCSSAFPFATDDAKGPLYMVMTTFKDPCSVSTGKCGHSNSQAGFVGDSA